MDTFKKYHTPYTIDLESILGETAITNYMLRIRKNTPAILNIMTAESTSEYLEDDLGPAFILEESAIEDLTRIIRDVLLGDLFIGDMGQKISDRLNVDQQTAQQIASRVVKDLFTPAIEDIKKIQQEKFPDRIKQGNDNQTPRPQAPLQTKTIMAVNRNNVVDLRNPNY